MPAGSFTLPSGQVLPKLPASCRVAGTIKPSADSNILFEVWLPNAQWNSRLQQVGNGGLAGSLALFYAGLPGALQRGYAVAGTDDGHQASGIDGSWAIGHPEKVKDFGYRAVNLTNMNAKSIATAFYGQAPHYSYFNACSEGGREAHMEAQRFPSDFDGILVGSPAHFWTDLMVRFQWDQHALLIDPASYIPASKLPAIQKAALDACDAMDGVVDGIVNDPRTCNFNPSALLCTGADNNSCLTAAQIVALKDIYEGPTNPRTGERISTGYERTGENSGNWNSYIIGPAPGAALQLLFRSASTAASCSRIRPGTSRRSTSTRTLHSRGRSSPRLSMRRIRHERVQAAWRKDDSVPRLDRPRPHPRGSIEYYEAVVAEQSPGKGNGVGEQRCCADAGLLSIVHGAGME